MSKRIKSAPETEAPATNGVPVAQLAPEPAKGKKTKCPISKAAFLKDARPLAINVNGLPLAGVVKEFSTGSFGWFLNGQTTADVGGVPVKVQLGFNLTVVGSKEADQAGFFRWRAEIAVDDVWVADGFELTAETLKVALMTYSLGYAHDHEVEVTVIQAPDRKDVRRAQGYQD